MKNIYLNLLLVAVLILIGGELKAQENDIKFLLEDTKAKITSYYVEVTPGTSWSSLMDNSINLNEIAGGIILNRKFSIAYFITTGNPAQNVAVPLEGSSEYQEWLDAGVQLDKLKSSTEFVYAMFRHSGLNLGYIHKDYKSIFWRGGLHFGFSGGFNLSEDNNAVGMFNNTIYEAKILTLEPSIGLGFNLLPWWRLHVDGGYRLINVDDRIIEAKKVDSFTFKFSFAFGNFGNKT